MSDLKDIFFDKVRDIRFECSEIIVLARDKEYDLSMACTKHILDICRSLLRSVNNHPEYKDRNINTSFDSDNHCSKEN